MEFPRLVIRAGGVWQLESGMYSVRQVDTREEYDAALSDGWHPDQYAAKAAHEAAVAAALAPAAPAAPEAPAVPTRADLEAEATALGVKFDGRVGDKTLAERIAAKKAA